MDGRVAERQFFTAPLLNSCVLTARLSTSKLGVSPRRALIQPQFIWPDARHGTQRNPAARTLEEARLETTPTISPALKLFV